MRRTALQLLTLSLAGCQTELPLSGVVPSASDVAPADIPRADDPAADEPAAWTEAALHGLSSTQGAPASSSGGGGSSIVIVGGGQGGGGGSSIPPASGPPIVPVVSCVPAPSAALALCAPAVAAVAGGQPYPTIQDAIDAHAEVDVCPGVHTEALTATAPLVLRSASGDAADTVLDGQGTQQILSASAPVVIEGLSFRDGWSSYAGGAVEATGGAQVTCSVFEDNASDYEGGALQARGDVVLDRVAFRGNWAGYEGGAVSWGDWAAYALTVEGCDFHDNHADYSGGAIEIGTWADLDIVEIASSTFTDNSDGYGTGVVAFDSWGGFDGRIEASTFVGNDQAIGANGWLLDGYVLEVVDTSITGDPGSW